jgi:hypothetical protein
MEYPDLTAKELETLHKMGVLNGCGREGWKIKPPYAIFYEASCNWHDFNYWKGGDEVDRLYYDKGFYKAMKRDVARLPWYNIPIYSLWAWIYYRSVRFGGDDEKSFHYGKKRNLQDIN